MRFTRYFEHMRSRLMSYYQMFFIGVAPLGHYASGWLAEHIGAPRTFMVNGAITLATGALFFAQLRKFRSSLRVVYVSRGIIPASQDTRMGNP